MTWNEEERICWHSKTVESISGFDAGAATDGIFKATHHPLPLRRQRGGIGQSIESSEEDLSKELYETPTVDGLVLIAVTGPSGSGKSHLIRYLYSHRPKEKNFHVVYIPKRDTTIRNAVNAILLDLGPEFNSVREMFKEARDDSPDKETGGEKILDALAYIMEDEAKLADMNKGRRAYDPAEKWILTNWKLLLQDINYRKNLIILGGPQRIASIPSGNHDPEANDENAIRFTVQDFPFSGLDTGDMAKEARSVYARFGTVKVLAIALLNDFLPEAIREVYFQQGPRFTDVITEIRRILNDYDRELVLLIEDLTVLAGVQKELIDAITMSSTGLPGKKDISTLRVAFAMTDGPYEGIFPTVATRILTRYTIEFREVTRDSHRIQTLNSEDQSRFISRYLNASRMSVRQLEEFGESESLAVCNTCDNCQVREKCHDAFGQIDGIGLYPFNKNSILNIPNSINPGNGNTITPRILIRNFIGLFLKEGIEEIHNKTFPSDDLMGSFNEEPAFDALLIDKIKTALGSHPTDLPKHKNLQRFWANNPRDLQNWPDWIQKCFALKNLTFDPSITTPPDNGNIGVVDPLPVVINVDSLEIDGWFRGTSTINANLAGKFRTMIFEVLDSELQTRYSLNTCPPLFSLTDGHFLRRDSIRIDSAGGGGLNAEFKFATIKINRTLEDTIVLKILQKQLTIDQNKTWNLNDYETFTLWIEHHINDLHNQYVSRYPNFDQELRYMLMINTLQGKPIDASVESIDALTIKSENIDIETLVRGRSEKWNRTITGLVATRKDLHKLVISALGANKSGGTPLSTRLAISLLNLTDAIDPFTVIQSDRRELTQGRKEIVDAARIELTTTLTLLANIETGLANDSLRDIHQKSESIISVLDREFPGLIITNLDKQELYPSIISLAQFIDTPLESPIWIDDDTNGSIRRLSRIDSRALKEIDRILSIFTTKFENAIDRLEQLGNESGAPMGIMNSIDELFNQLESEISGMQ